MPHTAPPDRAELLAWLGVSPDPGTAPDDYDLALAAALAEQASACIWSDADGVETYTESLHYAALRRAAVKLAAKGMPLGIFDAGDFGSVYLPRWDSEVERAEAQYRVGGFA